MPGTKRSGRRRFTPLEPTDDLKSALEQLDPNSPDSIRLALKQIALGVVNGKVDRSDADAITCTLKPMLASRTAELKPIALAKELEKWEALLDDAKKLRREGQARVVADRHRQPYTPPKNGRTPKEN